MISISISFAFVILLTLSASFGLDLNILMERMDHLEETTENHNKIRRQEMAIISKKLSEIDKRYNQLLGMNMSAAAQSIHTSTSVPKSINVDDRYENLQDMINILMKAYESEKMRNIKLSARITNVEKQIETLLLGQVHKIQESNVWRMICENNTLKCCPGFEGPDCEKECASCDRIEYYERHIFELHERIKRVDEICKNNTVIINRFSDIENKDCKCTAEPCGPKGEKGEYGYPGFPGPRGFRGFQGRKGDRGEPTH